MHGYVNEGGVLSQLPACRHQTLRSANPRQQAPSELSSHTLESPFQTVSLYAPCVAWPSPLGTLLVTVDFWEDHHRLWGFPGGSEGKESACNAGDQCSIPGLERVPWRREWQSTPVVLPEEPRGQRRPGWWGVCSSPRGRKDLDMAEWLTRAHRLSGLLCCVKETRSSRGYAPPGRLSASDGREQEDKKSSVFATSWEQLWGVVSTPELPQGQAEAHTWLAFPSLLCSPISLDSPSGGACSINPKHVNPHLRFCFWAIWPKTSTAASPPHDHLSSLRQTPLWLWLAANAQHSASANALLHAWASPGWGLRGGRPGRRKQVKKMTTRYSVESTKVERQCWNIEKWVQAQLTYTCVTWL